MTMILSNLISSIISGIISGIIANWLYEKRLRNFLNEFPEKIKNLPDELHRQALNKDFDEGNMPTIINNGKIEYSWKELNEMRNGEKPNRLFKDLRNQMTTKNSVNESKIWKIRNWFKKLF